MKIYENNFLNICIVIYIINFHIYFKGILVSLFIIRLEKRNLEIV